MRILSDRIGKITNSSMQLILIIVKNLLSLLALLAIKFFDNVLPFSGNKRRRSENNNSDDFVSAIPPEIREVILQKLDIASFHCFSAVCKSWRSIAVAAKHHQHLSFPQLPWLMLSTKQNDEQGFFSMDQLPWIRQSTKNSLQDDPQGFFSMDRGKVFKLNLPDAGGCRCCGSSWGWLILADRRGDNFLFNPFLSLQIQLPSQTTLPISPLFLSVGDMNQSYIRKAMLLTPPITRDGDDCIVVAIYELNKLCFCRPGDQAWTDFGNEHLRVCFEDMIVCNDQLYGVTNEYDLVLIELDPQPRATKLVTMPSPHGHHRHSHPGTEFIYLVESCGELLMVVRHLRYPTGNGRLASRITTRFNVFRFDSSGPRWIEVDNLCDQILFIGTTSLSVSATTPSSGFRGNCIYFTDDNFWNILFICEGPKTCRDLGVFNLDDRSIKSFFPTGTHSSLSPPVWYMPTVTHL